MHLRALLPKTPLGPVEKLLPGFPIVSSDSCRKSAKAQQNPQPAQLNVVSLLFVASGRGSTAPRSPFELLGKRLSGHECGGAKTDMIEKKVMQKQPFEIKKLKQTAAPINVQKINQHRDFFKQKKDLLAGEHNGLVTVHQCRPEALASLVVVHPRAHHHHGSSLFADGVGKISSRLSKRRKAKQQ